ncbi:hypothetical protein BH10BAC4_BH10BAC4_22970 [soil metagenome]
MNSDQTYQDFTLDELKQMSTSKSMFIVGNRRKGKSKHLTPIQYLLKINLLFIHALNNTN